MKVEVVLEDMSVGKNGAKVHTTQEDSLTCQGLNCEKNVYELEDHVR
jgi:hypothetical protein